MKNMILIAAILLAAKISNAQLADGSVAPDFSLTDIDGGDQNLYTYLDAGKTVYLDFFACHCPSCWAYHNTYALRDLYNNHGPSGSISQDVMVLAIEYDTPNGINELTGVSGVTQGDWVTGTPYPIINPEGAERTAILAAYDVIFYPMIYAICPDRKITLLGTQNEATLYNHVASCGAMGIPTNGDEEIQVYSGNQALYVKGMDTEEQATIQIYDLSGKVVLTQNIMGHLVSLAGFENGVYIYSIIGNKGTSKKGKFFR
jgi:thiol-disulfide isomerase/thioredoxin